MWFDKQITHDMANTIDKKIAQSRLEHHVSNTQPEAQQTRGGLNVAAAITRLFQRDESIETPAHRTV